MAYHANSTPAGGDTRHGDLVTRFSAAARGAKYFGRASEWHSGMLWWDANTVLVTRRVEPGHYVRVTRLVVPVDRGRLAFRISSQSEEARHLARDRRVIVQAGDWRGTPALGSREHQGAVEFAKGGPLFDKIEAGIRVKYGMRRGLARMAHRVALGAAPYADLAVVVTPYEVPALPSVP